MENENTNRWKARLESQRFVLARNTKNLAYASSCEMLLGILNLITYHWSTERYPQKIRMLYLGLQVFLLLFCAASLTVAAWAYRGRKKYSCYLRIYIHVFFAVSLLWGTAAALLDQIIYGQIITFTVIYVLCSSLLLTEPGIFWKLQTVPLLLLFLGLPLLQTDFGILIMNYVNLIVLGAGMGVFNYYSYLSFYRSGINRMEIGKLAVKDELTGLNNRRKMRMFIEETVRGRERLSSIGVIMFDIDYFKKYNDYYGHGMGDCVLTSIGSALNELSRQYGAFSARYGGEEFIVIVKNKAQAEVSKMAADIQRSVADLNIENQSLGPSAIISVSIGQYWTRRLPVHLEFSALIEKADAALYKAKRSGRDRICKDSA